MSEEMLVVKDLLIFGSFIVIGVYFLTILLVDGINGIIEFIGDILDFIISGFEVYTGLKEDEFQWELDNIKKIINRFKKYFECDCNTE